MREFAGRVAVVTGAAGGIGREIASVAAGLGMKLVLADARVHPLEEACGQLQARGAQVLAMVCDVRKGRLVQELADAAVARFGAVHLVVNGAHASAAGPAWEIDEAEWERVLGANLWGALHAARIFTRLMLDCAARHPGYQGHIVNMAPMAGPANAPSIGPARVSAQAVVALSETLSRDLLLAGAPVGVSVLCPPAGPDRLPPAQLAQAAFDAVRAGRLHA